MARTLSPGDVKTPGVYVEEVPLFPPSVAQVETAVPAFIGPTRRHRKAGRSVRNVPTKVRSMAEFSAWFGDGPDRSLTAVLDAANGVASVRANDPFYLYDSLLLYFGNGGEKCYIVSTGRYADAAPTAASYTTALDALRSFDEPTLVVLPDAVRLTAAGALATVQQAALDHCQAMQDRFAVLDVRLADPANPRLQNPDIDAFRSGVTRNLRCGAAYYPYLKTSLPLAVGLAALQLEKPAGTAVALDALLDAGPGRDLATAAKHLLADLAAAQPAPLGASLAGYDTAATTALKIAALRDALALFAGPLAFADPAGQTQADYAAYLDAATPDGQRLANLRAAVAAAGPGGAGKTGPAALDRLFGQVSDYVGGFPAKIRGRLEAAEAGLRRQVPLYAAVVAAAEAHGIVLPPSGAVAGAYARTDRERGVWKAPANVGLSHVLGPSVPLTDAGQAGLNVDPNAGKSINAIRVFAGRGTLIWGVRTLDGNNSEWRYVPVRRFFLMVEESVKKATAPFTFEPNDALTWARVRAMTENFLTLLWRAGALAGTKPGHAFFVRVGLGQTMTAQDVLNGLMIVEIGLATTRPDEFSILKFSHKMQQP